MNTSTAIGGDGALVLYSGDGDAFATHRDALGALGAARYLGTDPGHAALYDIALLSAMYGMFGGALHALAIIRAAGESATEFAPLLISWLTAMTGSVPELAKGADSGEHSSGGSDLAMQAAAYPNLLASSADLGVSTELMEPMRVLLERGVAAGHGHDGLSALVGLLLPASRS